MNPDTAYAPDTRPVPAPFRLALPASFDRLRRQEPLLTYSGLGFLLLGLLLPLLYPLSNNTILGVDPWFKPTKFALSIGIYVITIGALLAPLPQNRATGFVRITTFSAMFVEQAIIMLQSARGTTSHFNVDSALDGILFGIMGLAIALVTVAVIVLGVQWYRQRDVAAPLVRTAVLAGIGIMLLGSVVGQHMVTNGAHSVGVADEDATTGPLLKWTTNGGDLRAAHFLGLHALQAMPLVALALTRGARPATRGRWLVFGIVAAMYAGATIFLYAWALLGRPFLPV